MITIIPMMATDEKFSGGGAPRPPAVTPTPPAVQQPVQPTPPPPEVKQEAKAEKVEKVEPEKTEPEKIKRNDPDAPVVVKDKPPKREVQTSKKVVKLATAQQTNKNISAKTEADANAKANEAWKKAVSNAGRNISSGLSSSTKVDMPEGPGGGGVSYAPYGQIVRKIYTDGWQVPDDMTDDEATIKVSVTIARDGTVLSSRIVQPSGSAAANRSIQETLDRIAVNGIGIPFPAGAKESQRTFIMTFNLKAKKAFG